MSEPKILVVNTSPLIHLAEAGLLGLLQDDLAGRRCAEALGLPLRGTVGLVLAAKQSGLIQAARPILEQLRDHGMYLSDAVLNRSLRWVGE